MKELKSLLFFVCCAFGMVLVSCSDDEPEPVDLQEQWDRNLEAVEAYLQENNTQWDIDIEKIEAYVEDNTIDNVNKTSTGLHYVITEPGTGSNAAVGDFVSVHYTGTLLDGTKFDSSVDRNQSFQFNLGVRQVIFGWDEGIQLFKQGAKGFLYIPSQLAYGSNGQGSIGPNEVLVFEIELLSIN
ncbi:MAG: FKBP-type peptidyl-prolyl cis-trans isomerase [Cyclobacteriaceae bacterium]